MIVLDASAAIEWALKTPVGQLIHKRMFSPGETLHAPHLFNVEVCQVLRRSVLTRTISVTRAELALGALVALRLRRYAHRLLLHRVWSLRENLTAYDALYVALAEGLGATLITRDRRIAAAPGHRARVQVI